MNVDSVAAIIFVLLLALFLWRKRKQVEFQKMLFPILYVVLFRSKFGVRSMEYWAKKFPRFLSWAGYAGVILGFVGMVLISVQLIFSSIEVFLKPEGIPGIQPVLPIEAKGVFFVPFLYWIISIFLLALVHEFSHGVLAKVHKIPVKSSGFAFLCLLLPIIPAAFVEPDEKVLQKKRNLKQLSVFSAGPISNLVFAAFMLLLFAVFSPVLSSAFDEKGVELVSVSADGPAGLAGLAEGDVITQVDGQIVVSPHNLSSVLNSSIPGAQVSVKTLDKSISVTLGENPKNASLAFLGVNVKPFVEPKESFVAKYGVLLPKFLKWFAGLIFWLFMLNIGIGLFNLLPIGPLDGGRMFQLVCFKFFKKPVALKIWAFTSIFFIALIISNMLLGFFR
ncbi:MAG TPA: site-2 protease family protein [Candidatus Nanoarchaeia archaeon]|nr:site-2 protease family protein [Candidatus Nanoarchaeia archaeon]